MFNSILYIGFFAALFYVFSKLLVNASSLSPQPFTTQHSTSPPHPSTSPPQVSTSQPCRICERSYGLMSAFRRNDGTWNHYCSRCLECKKCHETFLSRNQLFNHLEEYPHHIK